MSDLGKKQEKVAWKGKIKTKKANSQYLAFCRKKPSLISSPNLHRCPRSKGIRFDPGHTVETECVVRWRAFRRWAQGFHYAELASGCYYSMRRRARHGPYHQWDEAAVIE